MEEAGVGDIVGLVKVFDRNGGIVVLLVEQGLVCVTIQQVTFHDCANRHCSTSAIMFHIDFLTQIQ